jgi:hypothetical protein
LRNGKFLVRFNVRESLLVLIVRESLRVVTSACLTGRWTAGS